SNGSHNLTVVNITDAVSNIILNNGTDNYKTFSVDALGPVLSFAAPQSSTNIRLVFSETLDATAAQNTANYKFNSDPYGTNISSAVLDVNGTDVILTASAALADGSHTVTVQNITDLYLNPIVMDNVDNQASFTISGADTTPPSITSVTASSDRIIRVRFSETVDLATAQTLTNYNVNSTGAGTDVQSAVRDTITTDVIVTMTVQGRFSQGTNSLTVLNVQDTAGNTILNNGTDNVKTFWVDTQGPVFNSVTHTSGTSLRLTFQEAVSPSMAVNVLNYEIDTNGAGANIASAVLDVDPKVVVLTLSGPLAQGLRTIKVLNMEDLYGNSIANNGIDDVKTVFVDTVTPVLNTISVLSPQTILLSFSESIAISQAQTVSSYQLDASAPGAGIASAVLQPNGTDVLLTTSSAMSETSHDVTVYGILDIYANSIVENGIDNKKSFVMDYPPVLNSAAVISATEVLLTFSEAVEQTGAETTGNYQFSHGISAASAVREADPTKVTLTLSSGMADGVHTVTVYSVTDLNSIPIQENNTDNRKSISVEFQTPYITAITVESNSRIRITYSEPMNETNVENVLNYQIDANPPGTFIDSAVLTGTSEVLIYLSAPFADASYNFTVTGVNDANFVSIIENGIDNFGSFTVLAAGTFDEGPVYTNPFSDGVSDLKLFTYDDRVYAGPNDAQGAVFRFKHDLSATATTTLDGDNVTAGDQSFYLLPNASGWPLWGADFFLPGCLGAADHTLSGTACSSAGGSQALFTTGYVQPSKGAYNSVWMTQDGGGSATSFRLGYEEISGFFNSGASPSASSIGLFKDQLYVCNLDAGGQSVLLSRVCVNPSGCANGDTYKNLPVDINGKFLVHIGMSGDPNNFQNGQLMGIDVMYEYDNDGPGGNASQFYVASGGSDNDIESRTLLSQANDGGVARSKLAYSTAANPPADGTHFEDVTPSSLKWLRYMSIPVPGNYGDNGICQSNGDEWDCLEPSFTYAPSLRAIPAMKKAQNGDLYMIRNACAVETILNITSTNQQVCPAGSEVPQLWMLPKGSTASPSGSGDWVLVAENPSANGRTNMSGNDVCGTPNKCDTENTHFSLLEVNGNYLYIGLENKTYGLNIWRVNMAAVQSGTAPPESSFSLVSSFGLGDPAANTRIFSSATFTSGADDLLFVSTGNGTNASRIFRTTD
ncbi:MAG: hypothetical protein OEZ34_13170, partial [Spirochaetia bacterium]|nr:hypothetical protein [Spirochaetia bacterium]